jgi:hypothetical protein
LALLRVLVLVLETVLLLEVLQLSVFLLFLVLVQALHAVDADWHHRTTTHRAIVEANLIGLFPIALSSNARRLKMNCRCLWCWCSSSDIIAQPRIAQHQPHRQRAHVIIQETAPAEFYAGGGVGDDGGSSGVASNGGSGAGACGGSSAVAGSGGSGASGGSGNIQMEVFTRNCDNDESFMQELHAATGFDSSIFGARKPQNSDSDFFEEDAAPTDSAPEWTARTVHIRIVVEMQILDRFPIVFSHSALFHAAF